VAVEVSHPGLLEHPALVLQELARLVLVPVLEVQQVVVQVVLKPVP